MPSIQPGADVNINVVARNAAGEVVDVPVGLVLVSSDPAALSINNEASASTKAHAVRAGDFTITAKVAGVTSPPSGVTVEKDKKVASLEVILTK